MNGDYPNSPSAKEGIWILFHHGEEIAWNGAELAIGTECRVGTDLPGRELRDEARVQCHVLFVSRHDAFESPKTGKQKRVWVQAVFPPLKDFRSVETQRPPPSGTPPTNSQSRPAPMVQPRYLGGSRLWFHSGELLSIRGSSTESIPLRSRAWQTGCFFWMVWRSFIGRILRSFIGQS